MSWVTASPGAVQTELLAQGMRMVCSRAVADSTCCICRSAALQEIRVSAPETRDFGNALCLDVALS